MSDSFRVFGEISLENALVIAGLGCLAAVVTGTVFRKVEPTPRTRAILAVLGLCFVTGGVLEHRRHLAVTPRSVHQGNRCTTTELLAQEPVSDHHVAAIPAGNQYHPVALSYFAGRWRNTDGHTQGLTKLDVRTAGESVW